MELLPALDKLPRNPQPRPHDSVVDRDDGAFASDLDVALADDMRDAPEPVEHKRLDHGVHAPQNREPNTKLKPKPKDARDPNAEQPADTAAPGAIPPQTPLAAAPKRGKIETAQHHSKPHALGTSAVATASITAAPLAKTEHVSNAKAPHQNQHTAQSPTANGVAAAAAQDKSVDSTPTASVVQNLVQMATQAAVPTPNAPTQMAPTPSTKKQVATSAISNDAPLQQTLATSPQTAQSVAAVPEARAKGQGQTETSGKTALEPKAQTNGDGASAATFKLDSASMPSAHASPQHATRETTATAPQAPQLTAHQPNIPIPPEALGVFIARKASEGANRFEVRLDPAELGRIDVTLDIGDDGVTRAHISVERPEALELLQRDAKGLEQALRQAGLQFDQSGLSYGLTDRQRQQEDHQHHGQGRRAKFQAALAPEDIAAQTLGPIAARDGLDLRV